jgi:hypothetical protein
MPLFWLAYRQDGTTRVMIVESPTLILARLMASTAIDGLDAHFALAIELPDGRAVPKSAIGRLLSEAEAKAILAGLERKIPKKAAAASVRRVVKRKRV